MQSTDFTRFWKDDISERKLALLLVQMIYTLCNKSLEHCMLIQKTKNNN